MSEQDDNNFGRSSGWPSCTDHTHTIANRARVRARLDADVDEFLRQGGRIEEVGNSLQSHLSRKVNTGFHNTSL
ncbi:MAG: hypothetical protein KGY54_12095 [Oleiphilaceae bacterium]|nr:hypothetical protein [Oleiphilaceae bacterium]